MNDDLDGLDELGDDMCGGEDDLVEGHGGQVIIVGCWLTIKEIALVAGTIARAVPFPGKQTASGLGPPLPLSTQHCASSGLLPGTCLLRFVRVDRPRECGILTLMLCCP